MNKKILAILMALLMVAMSSVAFAAGEATLTKNYTKEGDTAVAPAATFTFTVGEGDVAAASDGVTAPAASNITVHDAVLTADGTAEIDIDVNLDAFTQVGVYSYPITENDTKLAGVNYDTNAATLYVYVVFEGDQLVKSVNVKKGGEKSADGDATALKFDNVYQAGSLAITKEVTGAYGDPNMYFDVVVTLTGAEGQNYAEQAVVANGGKYTNEAVTIGTAKTLQIKHGETITLNNIPHDVTYTVEEADYTETLQYDAAVYAFSDEAKVITSTDADTVKITNNKDLDEEIETGVFTDNMPYFMLLAFVMILAAAVVLKKRTVNE